MRIYSLQEAPDVQHQLWLEAGIGVIEHARCSWRLEVPHPRGAITQLERQVANVWVLRNKRLDKREALRVEILNHDPAHRVRIIDQPLRDLIGVKPNRRIAVGVVVPLMNRK